MKIKYRFTNNTEPTDEQLSFLMKEVALEVRANAKKAEEAFYLQLNLLVKSVLKKHKELNG